MRDQAFLQQELDALLAGPFEDLILENELVIRWGRKAKRRFGSIKMSPDKRQSLITINGLFKEEWLPVEIIRATIAHELCHYAHGFSSPLPRLYRHPHQGGVVTKELKKRGLGALHAFERSWTKENWPKVVQFHFPQRVRRRVVRRRTPLERIIINLLKP